MRLLGYYEFCMGWSARFNIHYLQEVVQTWSYATFPNVAQEVKFSGLLTLGYALQWAWGRKWGWLADSAQYPKTTDCGIYKALRIN